MRRRGTGLVAEYRCEGLEAAPDVAQGFAVVGEVGRLLPCLLQRVRCQATLGSDAAIPVSDCIAAGSVPAAVGGCWGRPASSSGTSRRVTSPTGCSQS